MQVITVTLSDEVYRRLQKMALRLRTDVSTYTSALIADATTIAKSKKSPFAKIGNTLDSLSSTAHHRII